MIVTILLIGIAVLVSVACYHLGRLAAIEEFERLRDAELAERFPDTTSIREWLDDWVEGFGTHKADDE